MAAEDGSKQIEKNYKSAKETSTFEAINESMNQITDNISQISQNIKRQQAMGIVDVVKSMSVINDGAKAAAGMAQTQTAIHQLNDAAKSLKEITLEMTTPLSLRMKKFRELFAAESEEHLTNIEQGLLELESDPENSGLLHAFSLNP